MHLFFEHLAFFPSAEHLQLLQSTLKCSPGEHSNSGSLNCAAVIVLTSGLVFSDLKLGWCFLPKHPFNVHAAKPVELKIDEISVHDILQIIEILQIYLFQCTNIGCSHHSIECLVHIYHFALNVQFDFVPCTFF